ncbi:MAG: hypothetical protein BWK72_06485 [Rhodoferax ferrireducens]|uniref:Uncharacterized protein n=2 Tax=Pseudomonadota TaxID=1224 RepID=A0A1Y1QZ59_9GAMM|nr:MAG: hypothetical protein BWK72_06485 [Rhodoferax ferrireducens]OQX17181.1 MAG: hypothetical protein BWK73_00245 [Thiothrix lacustris]
MPTWTAPSVYLQEVSALSPSAVEVVTAVPAFVGYTAKADQLEPVDLTGRPVRITSLLDFEAQFGQAAPLCAAWCLESARQCRAGPGRGASG